MSEHPKPSRPPRQPLSLRTPRPGPLPESAAWNVVSTLMSGLIGFGVPGFLVDRWLGTDGWFTLVGLVLGMVGALTVVWFRYGTGRS